MKIWKYACIVAALFLASQTQVVTLRAQAKITVAQLSSFIQSSIQLRNDDRKVAEYVKKIKLSDKLNARTIEELQGKGAGPQTVAALKLLMTETASLPEAPPPAPKLTVVGPPPPDSIEQKRVLDEITRNALDYSKNLPNFLCLQVTRKYADQSGMDNFRLLDTVAEKLTYFDQKEEYTVISVNGVPVTGRKHEQLGGASSSGDFGTMLNEVFIPESQTEFNWERWATLRGRRMHVFSFRVRQEYSRYSILAEDVKRSIVVGYHGYIYADRDTNMVMRLTMEADNIPADFPVQAATEDLNYDTTSISGQDFVLPLKAEMHMRDGKYLIKNEIEFRRYNKFGADTSIQFNDVPDVLPDDKTKELPAK